MIEPMCWEDSTRDELASPFMRGPGERPLRLTFHNSGLATASPKEQDAWDLLKGLCHVVHVEALQTEPGPFGHLEIKSPEQREHTLPHIPVVAHYKDGRELQCGIWAPSQWPQIAAELMERPRFTPDDPELKRALDDLLIARAHHEVGGDILVTLSPFLLRWRDVHWISQANPRTPIEAAQILGLFLRSRDNYTYYAAERMSAGVDRWLFYWVLARHRLPSFWKYFSACVHASRIAGDDLERLGGSILTRCVRAIQARDAIGEQFYVPQGNNSAERMMYHFDYLTLLLSGALDAQALIACRAYDIATKERNAGFRRDDFRKKLAKAGAGTLHSIVTGQQFEDIATLIYKPRNTIHGAGPTPITVQSSDRRQTFVQLPSSIAASLWNAAERLGSHDRCGLLQDVGNMQLLEPYSYATTLVSETLKIIDEIAAATRVEGLFPKGSSIPPLDSNPPQDDLWQEERRERFALLG